MLTTTPAESPVSRRYEVTANGAVLATYATKLLADIHAARANAEVVTVDPGHNRLQRFERPVAQLIRYWTVDTCDGTPRIRFEWTVGGETHVSIAEACYSHGERSYIILDGELAEDFDADLSVDLIDRLHYERTDEVGHESGDQARAAFEAFYSRDIGPDPILGQVRS